MYQTLLLLHSWSRWFVIIFGLIAVYRAYVGYTGRRPFVRADNGMSAAFSGFVWLQVIIGFGLYFGLSPYGLNAMKQAGAMTVGQDAASCVVYGMPRVAFDMGAVDKQVTLTGIAREIVVRLQSLENAITGKLRKE